MSMEVGLATLVDAHIIATSNMIQNISITPQSSFYAFAGNLHIHIHTHNKVITDEISVTVA